jgi:hypothetical protein
MVTPIAPVMEILHGVPYEACFVIEECTVIKK